MESKEMQHDIHSEENNDYLYERVARQLKRMIDSGAYAHGSRLPSLDDLAKTHNVNRLTARKAVSMLRREGLVYAVPAQGTYVSAKSPERVAARAASSTSTAAAGGGAAPRAMVIGLISHVLKPASFGYYHQSVLAGIQGELDDASTNLLVIPGGCVSQDDLPELMRRSNADAMIYLGAFDTPVLSHMLRNGPPAVVVDFRPRGIKCDMICFDNEAGAADAVRHIVERGWGRSMAVITGIKDDAATIERCAGIRFALDEARIPHKRMRFVSGEYIREGGAAAMSQLLRAAKPPRAVFCLNDEMALGALDAAQAAGLRVPDDIAIFGFDDIILAQTSQPQLSSVRVDTRQMGRLAVRALRARLKQPDATVSTTVLPARLVLRGTT